MLERDLVLIQAPHLLIALSFSAYLSMHIALPVLSFCSPGPMRQWWSSCFYLYQIFFLESSSLLWLLRWLLKIRNPDTWVLSVLVLRPLDCKCVPMRVSLLHKLPGKLSFSFIVINEKIKDWLRDWKLLLLWICPYLCIPVMNTINWRSW